MVSQIIPAIVKYALQIEEIEFASNAKEENNFISNAKCLKHLKALKSLEIDRDSWSTFSFSPIMDELVETRIPLESLKLSRFDLSRELISGMAIGQTGKDKEIRTWFHRGVI